MKIASTRSKISKPATFGGLLTGHVDHEIKETKASLKWTGPKIGIPMWEQVLAFFVDTFKETRSECQVRLYVNLKTNDWHAWAFPQKARSHMNAEELQTPEGEEQRKQFKSSEGFLYLGTVHHHCGLTAFQSGTDRDNERNQDGLHITVGKLDEKQYDIHARFYFDQVEFIPDMSAFWDVGEPWASAHESFVNKDLIARHQMTLPINTDKPEAGKDYPEQWKKNLIDFKPVQIAQEVIHVNGKTIYRYPNANESGVARLPGETFPFVHGPATTGQVLGNGKDNPQNSMKRREKALKRTRKILRSQGVPQDEIDECFNFLIRSTFIAALNKACREQNVSPADVVREWEWDREIKHMTETQDTPDSPDQETAWEHMTGDGGGID